MPITKKTTTGGIAHLSPFVGPVNHTVAIRVDISALTTNEVDADGYIKPGVLLQESGIPIGAAPAYAYGAVVEATKIASVGTAAALAAEADVDVAVVTHADINQDILEDVLGRALTANEIAGTKAAGSKISLV